MYFSSGLSTICVFLILCLESASCRNEDSIDGSSLVTFDDDNFSDDEDESSTRYLENGLCVPQDRLEDIEFFPNFKHDLIRLGHTSESDVEFPNDLECNKDYVAKVLRDNQDHDHGQVEEIDKVREQNLRGKPSIENSFNDSGISVEQDDESKGGGLEIFSSYHDVSVRRKNIGVGKFPLHIQKKPRTKRMRKGNQILTFPVLEKGGGKRILENEDGKRRRCRHCQAEDTPQWRIGPSGPNTLCNACGLRYKVGRLVPNYRPAASPSFDSAKHSNFYKRLMRERDYVNR